MVVGEVGVVGERLVCVDAIRVRLLVGWLVFVGVGV